MNELDARRYRITAVLGTGGNGKVYRATLQGAGGFEKDVAIKLMRDDEVPELALQRFRDEARILGLIRDRAIVTVDPPTRLAGRWAVVMEYVDGASLQRLMKLGPIPAGVVAEIVREIARALDKVYRQNGPNGEPLHLLHRDIKPANLQITPDGEVKILDFGIAKANFETREAETQAYIGGTRGFIAPERLEGVDTPAGDIFSLGVTAHWMLMGQRPTRREMMGLDEVEDTDLNAVGRTLLALFTRMRAVAPVLRPTAREVEALCAEIGQASGGPSLREWAEEEVPKAIALHEGDPMVGSVLTETLAVLPTAERLEGQELILPPEPRQRRRRRKRVFPWMLAGSAVAVVLVAVPAAVLTAVMWAASTDPEPDPLPLERPAGPVTLVGPFSDPTSPPPAAPPAAEVDEATPDDPATAAIRPAPAPSEARPPAPARSRVRRPAPARSDPRRTAPPEAVSTRTITITSVPMGADLFIDDRAMGQTPLLGHAFPEGTYRLKVVSDSETSLRTIEIGRRTPSRYVWKGGDQWEDHY